MRAGLLAASVLASAASLVVSCSLLVPGDVPAYRCTGADPSSCPPTMVCDEDAQLCVVPSATEPPGEDIDEPEGEDAGADSSADSGPAGPAEIGGDCRTNRDCEEGLVCGTSAVLTPSVLTPSVVTADEGACTTPCCTSLDCPPSFVCFNPGTGGNYCVSATSAKRLDPGKKTPGQTCAGHVECRSALCSDGRCLDTCCTEADCAEGTVCRIKDVSIPRPSRPTWSCAPPEPDATLGPGASCSSGCLNDNCAGVPPVCRPSCCSSAQCEGFGNNLAVCAYGEDLSTKSQLKWCFAANPTGKELGEECSGDLDCQSRLCDREKARCAAACCTDRDCSSGMACRPIRVGNALLRCVAVAADSP